MSLQYNHKMIEHAKELRKNMTPWERKLWFMFLRNYPVRFQRQKVIGTYIADFYCHKAGLVIELDGSQHYDEEQAKYDAKRTEYLKGCGLTVIRFSNLDVDKNFDSVCEYINLQVQMLL